MPCVRVGIELAPAVRTLLPIVVLPLIIEFFSLGRQEVDRAWLVRTAITCTPQGISDLRGFSLPLGHLLLLLLPLGQMVQWSNGFVVLVQLLFVYGCCLRFLRGCRGDEKKSDALKLPTIKGQSRRRLRLCYELCYINLHTHVSPLLTSSHSIRKYTITQSTFAIALHGD